MKFNYLLYEYVLFCLEQHLPEDFCGIEPITHLPDVAETRPPPIVDEDKLKKAYDQTDSAVLGSKLYDFIYRIFL